MKFTVHLMDSATGEVAVREEEWSYGWSDEKTIRAAIFQWSENNYSCDCNRLPFFCRAKGTEEPDETMCGDPLILAKLMLGDEVLFSDWIDSEGERAEYAKRVAEQRKGLKQ